MWQFSIFIGNRRKHKTTDIWRYANEDQCVPDKTGCSCRKITRSVRLARQGCWCCACRSSSPVLHESYCRITSWWLYSTLWSPHVTSGGFTPHFGVPMWHLVALLHTLESPCDIWWLYSTLWSPHVTSGGFTPHFGVPMWHLVALLHTLDTSCDIWGL